MSATHGRRSFMSVLASISGILALDGRWGRASAQAPARPTAEFDLTWLDQLTGQHKQAFDYGAVDLSVDTRPLRFVRNYLDPFRDVFGLESPAINTAVGISRLGFPLNASDAIWQKYTLGERWKIMDPTTGRPAVRNVHLSEGDESVTALQARGTVFWQCNVALGGVVRQLSQATGVPAPEVRAELVAGLVPGVRLVPSHVLALGLAQEKGFTYMKA